MPFARKTSAIVATVVSILALHLSTAAASTGPRWSMRQLARFSDAIVVGRVGTVTSGWDGAADTLYTYVSVDVSEVIKGRLRTGRLIIKQLGGESGAIGLQVFDQASFASGEDVLLFLEMRPRDHTLYTAALAQGKWNMRRRADGARVARRDADSETLVSIRGAVADQQPAARPQDVTVNPADAAASQSFTLMTTPYLYTFFPAIDVQEGGQEGLAGGGVDEIQTAAMQWSRAGSTFRYSMGSTTGHSRCASQFLSSYRVTIAFLDPCGEISNNGGTLAIGGSYFSTLASTTVNGRSFRLALEGFVINNDSSVALNFLRQTGCFHNIELHELGHVLGLGHSLDPSAIMYPSISTACSAGPSGLALDDILGIRSIYPPDGTIELPGAGVPGPSKILRATEAGDTLTVEWETGRGPAPTAHRLDFVVDATGQLITVPVGSATMVDIPVPSGTRGTFSVRITPFNAAVPGPVSAPFPFGIALDEPCNSPPPAPNVTGAVVGGTAVVGWPAVLDATNYLLQAGTSRGGSDLMPLTDLGPTTGARASDLPPGFTAWVRVVAVSPCGHSAPTDFFLQ